MKTDGFIQIDPTLCTGCRHCAKICPVQAITGDFRKPQVISAERCVACGQCVQICSAFDSQFDEPWSGREERMRQNGICGMSPEPCFAAWDRSNLASIKNALGVKDFRSVVHCDELTLASISEDFGLPAGTIRSGQFVSALRKLGFTHIYSSSLAAGLYLQEQARNLAERLKRGVDLPVIDSFCPAVVRFMEQSYPDLLPALSECRSPRQIAGSLTKSLLTRKFKVNANALYSVSLVSCTAHKLESERRELQQDVDAVLTGRELAQWLKQEKIDPADLQDSEFDQDLQPVEGLRGLSGHVGVVARTVLEAMATSAGAVQNVVEQSAGKDQKQNIFSVQVGQKVYTAASITGLQQVAVCLDEVRRGKSNFQFLELRACPMGCVNGGGQPKILLPKDRKTIYAARVDAVSCKSALSVSTLSDESVLGNFRRESFQALSKDEVGKILQTKYVAKA